MPTTVRSPRCSPNAHAGGDEVKFQRELVEGDENEAPRAAEMQRADDAMARLDADARQFTRDRPVLVCMGVLYIKLEECVTQCFYVVTECPCLDNADKREMKKWGAGASDRTSFSRGVTRRNLVAAPRKGPKGAVVV